LRRIRACKRPQRSAKLTHNVVGRQYEHQGIAIAFGREQGGGRDRKTRVVKHRLEHDVGLLLAMTIASWLHSVPAQTQSVAVLEAAMPPT